MQRRYLSRTLLAAAGATALAVTGCGSSDDGGSGSSASSGKDPKDVHIAFITAASSQNFTQEMMEGARAAGEDLGIDLKVSAPSQVDGPAQVQLFQNAMRTSKDGIAIETLTPPLLSRPESTAVRQGIPVIAVDTPPLPDSGVKTYVGNDNYEAAAMLAREAAKEVPQADRSSGTAVIGNPAPGIPTLDNRAKGMAATLKQELPGWTVKGPYDVKTDPTSNLSAWTNLFNANREASIFLDGGDSGNASLAKIHERAGGDVLTAGFDLNPAALEAVKSGTNFAFTDPQHFLKGYVAVTLLAEKALKGTAIPEGWWKSPAALVTKDDVDQIIARQQSRATKKAFYKPTLDKELADPQSMMQPLSEAR